MDNKYQKGTIYKITDIGYNKCYIGSTCEKLCHRMSRHRQKYKQFLNNPKQFISSYDLFNEYGVENCKIELIEYFPCDTLQELRRKEGEHIKKTVCVNKVVAGRTDKEWCEDNKDKILEQNKKYREQNKDKISEYKKEYRDKNRDKILEQKKKYREQNKDKISEYHKDYHKQNKDKISEYKKQWHETNKEKIIEYGKQYREANKLKKEMNEPMLR